MKYIYRTESVLSVSDTCTICEGLENRGCKVVSIVYEADKYGDAYRIFYKEPID